VFPFAVAFDDQLTIVYVGRTLQKLFDADTAAPARKQSLRRESTSSQSTDARHRINSRKNVQLIGRPLAQHFSLIRPQMTELTWHNVRLFASMAPFAFAKIGMTPTSEFPVISTRGTNIDDGRFISRPLHCSHRLACDNVLLNTASLRQEHYFPSV